METVIGVFDPRNVEKAVQALYAYGLDKNQVRVADRQRNLEKPSLNNLVVGLGTGFNGVVGQATGPAAVVNDEASKLGLAELGVTDATGFYTRSLESGSTILVVKATYEQSEDVRQIMVAAHASNVTEPPTDEVASV